MTKMSDALTTALNEISQLEEKLEACGVLIKMRENTIKRLCKLADRDESKIDELSYQNKQYINEINRLSKALDV